MDFSDYIVYVDESGDHGLVSIDPDYPVFVLCFCIFTKTDYASVIVPRFLDLKFRFFGHDYIILHGHEIRKARGNFRILFQPEIRGQFITAINKAIELSPFTLIAAVIKKDCLRQRYSAPDNPYEIAMTFCMERTYALLRDQGQNHMRTHVVVERRGNKEDRDLELAFRRVADGANRWGNLPFDIVFADKKANSTGLQIADLIAHPVGRHAIKPAQENRAWNIVENKFRRAPNGNIRGWGLKIFP